MTSIEATYPNKTPETIVVPIENNTGWLANNNTPAPMSVVIAESDTAIRVPVFKLRRHV